MKYQRKNYMVSHKNISKLKSIKDKTGASHSHSVRKAVDQYKPKTVKFKDDGR